MNGAKFPREPELVTKDGSIQRLRIPGGWIVFGRSHYINGTIAVACSEAMIEIQDRPGFLEWNLEEI